MNDAFGDARTFPASDSAKTKMKQLVSKGLFHEQGDVWRLGAARGIALGQIKEGKKRGTFQNVNSLDPEGVLAAIMVGLYPDMTPEERAKKLVDHAEWGIDDIYRQSEIGTLDWSQLSAIRQE